MTHAVLFLVLVVVLQSDACPIMCTCSGYSSDTSKNLLIVSCAHYSENITQQLNNTTSVLSFRNINENQFQFIINNLVKTEIKLPYLAHLTITDSDLEHLSNLTLSGLNRIRSLNLSGNKIANLSKTSLNLKGLQNMDLSNNMLRVIDNQPFRTLRTLEVLNLSANILNSIRSDSFSGLIGLKCLDLSENNLTALGDKVLSPLSTLQYLNLSGNRLEVLNEKCFSNLVKLQQLDVSWNRLARVAPGSLHLPSLARLLLAGNPKLGRSREPALLVGTGRRLQTVDASRTGLKQVPAALTHSIRTLRLAGNSIQIVRSGDLDSYPLLQLLDFNSNHLEIIEDDALGRLDTLSILYLTDNDMKEIPKSLPERLKVLHMEHNKIEKICKEDIQGLILLEVLLLNDNKISEIEEDAFSSLNSLITLDLSRNPIKTLENGYFSGPVALQVLRLSDIGIITPAKEVSFPLSTTEHLTTLDLSKSPGLAKQLLVDTAALASCRELQELNLSYTNIEYIRSDLLHFLPQLRAFHIVGNNINCTHLQWLASWMRRQDDEEYKKITCANPSELWGTLLIDLEDDEISSDYQQVTQTTSTAIRDNNIDLQINSKNKVEEEINIFTTFISILANNSTIMYDYNTSIIHDEEISNITDLLTELNVTQEFFENEDKNETSYIFFEEIKFNESDYSTDMNNLVSTDDAIRSNSSSTGEMSMLSTFDQERSNLLHPGMLILGIAILGASAALVMLASRFVRKRQNSRQFQQHDFEGNSLSGMAELW